MVDRSRDVVLFIGAGFSDDAGLPLMARFGLEANLDQFAIASHASAPDDSSQHRYAAPLLATAAEMFERFRDRCRRSGMLSDEDWNNIETLFVVIEALEEAGETHVRMAGEDYSLEHVREQIQLWIWKVYQQMPVGYNETDYTNRHSYKRLFRFLGQAGLTARTTVLSMNYDVAYEFLSWSHGIKCSYPFDWDMEKFSAGHGKEPWVLNPNDRQDTTLVCKLHGSINYFEAASKEDELFVASDLGNEERIGKSGVWKGRPAIFAVDSISVVSGYKSKSCNWLRISGLCEV